MANGDYYLDDDEEQLTLCNTTGVDRAWADVNVCGDLPISLVILITVIICWVLLLLVTGCRRLKHSLSSTPNYVVAKKMQHFEFWWYAFFHTMIYALTVLTIGSLVLNKSFVSVGFLAIIILVAVTFESQVDVLGNLKRSQGANDISFLISGEYLLTTYLAKVVWKASGHIEFTEIPEYKPNKLEKICCLGDLHNRISPRAYDIKDVVGIQGAFLAIPALFVYFFTFTGVNVSVADVGNSEDPLASFHFFDFNLLFIITLCATFISALSGPLLGDWETYSKSILKCLAALVIRSFELIARLLFYVYFCNYTSYFGFFLMFGEFLVMLVTNVSSKGTSSNGRTGSYAHYLLSSWESLFFGFYRRIRVDKDFVAHNTLMPTTIEFLRFIVKAIATIVGYIVMAGGNIPTSYHEAVEGLKTTQALFFAGVCANFIVLVYNLISFLCINRKEMSTKDLQRLVAYWKQYPPYTIICPGPMHVNRDIQMGNGINYV